MPWWILQEWPQARTLLYCTGFVLLPRALSNEEQRHLIAAALQQYPEPPANTNHTRCSAETPPDNALNNSPFNCTLDMSGLGTAVWQALLRIAGHMLVALLQATRKAIKAVGGCAKRSVYGGRRMEREVTR